MRFKRHVHVFKGRVDLTPLIDVVFQLLIFFMLSSSYVMQPGILVDLPESKLVGPARGDNLVVTVTREGQTFFNNRPIARPNLRFELERAAEMTPEATLIVQADRSVPHGDVVSIMSAAMDAGLGRVAIATRPTAEERLSR